MEAWVSEMQIGGISQGELQEILLWLVDHL